METQAIAESRIAPTGRRSRTPHERPNVDTDDPAGLQPTESQHGEGLPSVALDADTGSPTSVPAAAGIRARGPWRLAFERLRRDRAAIASGVVIVLVILLAICAPLVAVHRFYVAVNALAVRRGRNPDAPPHLSKVTETV
jgi:hypothetical protein